MGIEGKSLRRRLRLPGKEPQPIPGSPAPESDQEHQAPGLPGQKGCDLRLHRSQPALPPGETEAEFDLRGKPVGVGKQGMVRSAPAQGQPFRAPEGQGIVLPGGQGLLPGVIQEKVPSARVCGDPAHPPVGKDMGPGPQAHPFFRAEHPALPCGAAAAPLPVLRSGGQEPGGKAMDRPLPLPLRQSQDPASGQESQALLPGTSRQVETAPPVQGAGDPQLPRQFQKGGAIRPAVDPLVLHRQGQVEGDPQAPQERPAAQHPLSPLRPRRRNGKVSGDPVLPEAVRPPVPFPIRFPQPPHLGGGEKQRRGQGDGPLQLPSRQSEGPGAAGEKAVFPAGPAQLPKRRRRFSLVSPHGQGKGHLPALPRLQIQAQPGQHAGILGGFDPAPPAEQGGGHSPDPAPAEQRVPVRLPVADFGTGRPAGALRLPSAGSPANQKAVLPQSALQGQTGKGGMGCPGLGRTQGGLEIQGQGELLPLPGPVLHRDLPQFPGTAAGHPGLHPELPALPGGELDEAAAVVLPVVRRLPIVLRRGLKGEKASSRGGEEQRSLPLPEAAEIRCRRKAAFPQGAGAPQFRHEQVIPAVGQGENGGPHQIEALPAQAPALQSPALRLFVSPVFPDGAHPVPGRAPLLELLRIGVHLRVPEETADHAVILQRVVRSQQAHGQVVDHKGTHHPHRFSPLRGEVHRLVKAADPLRPQGPEPPQVFHRGPGNPAQGQERGIGGDHPLPIHSPFQGQGLDALGLVDIMHPRIHTCAGALRAAPYSPYRRPALHLRTETPALPEQGTGPCGQEEFRHEVLEHGAGPGGQTVSAPPAGHDPAQAPPVLQLRLSPGYGDITGDPGLAGQKVVPASGRPVSPGIPADMQELPLPVIEEIQGHLSGQDPRLFRQCKLPRLLRRPSQGDQAGQQVPAVHGGDVGRLQRREAPDIVPVVQVSPESGHGLQRIQHMSGQGKGGSPVREPQIPGGHGAEQGQADIGGTGALRDLLLRDLLQVIRGKPVPFLCHQALEIPPDIPGGMEQEDPVLLPGTGPAAALPAHGPAQKGGHEPEDAQGGQDGIPAQQAQKARGGAGKHPPKIFAQVVFSFPAFRRRHPLQQFPPGDQHPPQGGEDGGDMHPGAVGQEQEKQQELEQLRYRRGQGPAPAASSAPQGLQGTQDHLQDQSRDPRRRCGCQRRRTQDAV